MKQEDDNSVSPSRKPGCENREKRGRLERIRKLIEDLGGLAAGAIALAEGVRQLVDWLF